MKFPLRGDQRELQCTFLTDLMNRDTQIARITDAITHRASPATFQLRMAKLLHRYLDKHHERWEAHFAAPAGHP